MKFSNVRAVEKHLKDASPHHFSALYAVLSEDAFERKNLMDLMLKHLVDSELAVKILDGDHLQPSDILAELNALNLLTPKRAIVIQKADKLTKPVTVALEKYFARPNTAVHLIINAEALSRATNFYKAIEKHGVLFEAAEEKPWEREKRLVQWLSQKAEEQGIRMLQMVSEQMVKQIGCDQASLHHELEKLICYVGGRQEITSQDIAAVGTSGNPDTVWQLGEALFKRDVCSALRIVKALLLEGTSLLPLLRQIRSQYQTHMHICSIMHAGGNPEMVTQQFPYMKGKLLEKNLELALHYGASRVKQGLLHIDRTELEAKNSGAEEDFLAERLVIELAK